MFKLLSRGESADAAAAGEAARARQAAGLRRARPAERDPRLLRTAVSTTLLRTAAEVVDHDSTLVAWIEERIAASRRGEGRPCEFPVRSALIAFVLLAICGANFHVLNLPTLLSSLSRRSRAVLGVDYKDGANQPRQVSYQQLLRSFHAIARAFDPLDPDLNDAEANDRARDLRELSFRLIQAGITDRFRPGDVAVDATLKWGWDRPSGLNRKVERRGRDGDAGAPPTLSEIVEGEEAAFVRDPLTDLRHARRSTRGPSTWGPGSAWVGRPNLAKSVYGVALHAVTATTPNAPPVIEAISVSPANGLPAPSALPLLRQLQESREQRGCRHPLGNVVADPAYTIKPSDWQLPIRELGGSPIFRLHRTNQAGRDLHQGVTFVDGRPYCSCIPNELAELEFPKFPARKSQYEAFQVAATKRRRFEMKANTGFRSDGTRQFKAPHWDPKTKAGGCPHCVHADGTPVDGKVPCCSQATKLFDGDELGLYQDVAFGEPEWFRRWNARDRVEGSFGAFKNLALVNWGHDYHHFVGLVRETLVATFAVIAHNFHAQRTFAVRQRLAPPPPRRPRTRLTEAVSSPLLPRSNGAMPKRRGPKGLEFLGSPRAGP